MTTVNDRRTALWQAETALNRACETLLGSSPGSVDAFTSLLPLDQVEGEPKDWRNVAKVLAARHHLDFEFSTTRTHIRIRFSRNDGANGA
jgi:hypothetical protein